MVQHIVVQAILCQWVVAVIRLVGYPVVRQLFVAKHQHAQVAVFVIFDDRKRGKGLAQTNAVCQNAAIELLQLADDGKGGILLEGVQLVPDDAFLKAVGVAGQVILADVLQKVPENIVQRKKIEKLRAVFLIGGGDAFQHGVGDILQALLVVPDRVEQLQILCALGRINTVDHGKQVAAALAAQVGACKTIDWSICHRRGAVDGHKIGDSLGGLVGFEADLAANPVGAFAGDGFLAEIIAQSYLKFAAVQGFFAVAAGNIEPPPRLGGLFLQKSRGGEQKAQLLDVFQLGFQLLIRIHRKARCRNGNAAVALHRHAQIIHQFFAQVVDEFHGTPRWKVL
mgnify:CR=1 FL=1